MDEPLGYRFEQNLRGKDQGSLVHPGLQLRRLGRGVAAAFSVIVILPLSFMSNMYLI